MGGGKGDAGWAVERGDGTVESGIGIGIGRRESGRSTVAGRGIGRGTCASKG